MQFYKAEISDILRANQRDKDFLQDLQEYVIDFLKLVLGPRYNTIQHLVPLCTNAWYYLLTSASNLQTLGEEYTGTIRVDPNNKLIPLFGQLLWLALYIGGNHIFDRLLVVFGKKIHQNVELTQEAKNTLLHITDFLKENKYLLSRIHQSIFYIFGTYHCIANRLTGIRYVLLRQWMQDTAATTSFNILGYVSLIYLIYLIVEKIRTHSKTSHNYSSSKTNGLCSRMCALCADNCRDISATPCGHLFCWECIHDCLKFQQTCPVCREDVKPSRIIPLQNF